MPWSVTARTLSLLLGLLSFAALAQEHIHEAAPLKDDEYVERMAKAHADDYPVANLQAMEEIDRGIGVTTTTYGEYQGKPLDGYLALSRDRPPPRAGVIVFHEWWGLNDNVKAMTRLLADQGYAALAVDLYGQKTDDPAQARELMTAALADKAAMNAKIEAAYTYLTKRLRIKRVGTIGWCFGGGVSYQSGLVLGNKLSAVVIYYGQVGTEAAVVKPLTAPVLGIFGGADTGIPADLVNGFKSALEANGRHPDIRVYPQAAHAFANPSGRNYRPEDAASAWKATTEFLKRLLRPDSP